MNNYRFKRNFQLSLVSQEYKIESYRSSRLKKRGNRRMVQLKLVDELILINRLQEEHEMALSFQKLEQYFIANGIVLDRKQ